MSNTSEKTKDEVLTELTLGLPSYTLTTTPPPSPPRSYGTAASVPPPETAGESSNSLPPPFPWSANNSIKVRSLANLRSDGITSVGGEVHCKRCNVTYSLEFNLEHKFSEIAFFMAQNKDGMHHRAPEIWTNPALPNCRHCNQSVKPVIGDDERSINWLFLLLGNMLGCCTLAQLKNFCKHTNNHRTGAKDRLLFLAYLELCRQLDPTGPYAL